ncbi:MAG: dephospho-CoA kinase [Thermovirgaceae bacterium]
MLVVGLTGDIGAGKSTLADFWKRAGASVVSADAIVDEIWKQGILNEEVCRRWGQSIISDEGHPDHKRIASIIFENEEEYRWLGRIIHPLVRSIMEGRILSMDGWVVAEIPLLFENSVPWWVDETAYVTASLNQRISRNSKRKWSTKEILRREDWLLSSDKKRELADYVVENEGELEDLFRTAMLMAAVFREMASCVTLSVEWENDAEARDFAERLGKERLVAFSEIVPVHMSPGKSSGEISRAWRIEAVTTERLFPVIMEMAHKKGKFPRSARIRKTDKSLRNWIREAQQY